MDRFYKIQNKIFSNQLIIQVVKQAYEGQYAKVEQLAHDHQSLTFSKLNYSPLDYHNSKPIHTININKLQYKRRKIDRDKPKQKQLCQALIFIKKTLPMRSIEQTIIRMYHTVEAKLKMHEYAKQYVFAQEKSQKQNAKQIQLMKIQQNQMNRQNQLNIIKMQEANQQLQFKQTQFDNNTSHQLNNYQSNHNFKYNCNQNQSQNLDNIQIPDLKNQIKLKIQSQNSVNKLISQLPQAPPNYIYKPRDKQITFTYKQRDSRPVMFHSPQDQAKYMQRKFVVQAFLEHGYGFNQPRDKILDEGLSFQISPLQYKSIAGGVAILAFKKLQSFLINQCGKLIIKFNRTQIRQLCGCILSCKNLMKQHEAATVCKYLKAGVGLGDVTVGEIQSVTVYLSFTALIHKKPITMEAIQAIGQQEHFKKIDSTLQLIKNKKLEKQAKAAQIKQLRSNKISNRKNQKINKNLQQSLSYTKDCKYQEAQIKNQDQSKKQIDKYQSLPFNEQEALALWNDSMDFQFIEIYLQRKSVLVSFRIMKNKYPNLHRWPSSLCNKKFSKIVKKAVRKVQMDSQLCQNPTMPILNRLSKDELKKIIYSKTGENVRTSLLEYYKLNIPSENQLANVANITNMFVFTNIKNESQQNAKKMENQPRVRRKRGRPFKYIKTQYFQDIDYETIKAIKVDDRISTEKNQDTFKINQDRPLSNKKIKNQQDLVFKRQFQEQLNQFNTQDNNQNQGIYFSDQSQHQQQQNDLTELDVSLLTFQNMDEQQW